MKNFSLLSKGKTTIASNPLQRLCVYCLFLLHGLACVPLLLGNPAIPFNPEAEIPSKPITEDPEEEGDCEDEEDGEDTGLEAVSSLFGSTGGLPACSSEEKCKIDPRYCGPGPISQGCIPANGCIDYWYPFGSVPYLGSVGKGGFRLLKVKPSPDLFDPSALSYQSVSGSWIRMDETSSAGVRKIRVLGRLGAHMEFVFASGAAEGLPQAPYAQLKVRARLVDANGAVVNNVANNQVAFLELTFEQGSVLRYDLASGNALSFKNNRGRITVFADLPEAIRTEVVREGNTLRQVKAAEGLVDIVLLPDDRGFEMRRYAPLQVGTQGADGVFAVTGNPSRVIRFENPRASENVYEEMRITEEVGTRSTVYNYKYNEALDDWTLTRGGGASREEKALISQSGDKRTYERRLYDASNTLVARQRFSEWHAPWNEIVRTELVNDFGGANLTKSYTYYATQGENGYGKLKKVTDTDGSWTEYFYDAQGRVIRTVRPWLDTGTRTAEFSYAPVDSGDVATPLDTRVRSTTIKINGIIVGKNWNAYVTNANGESQEITESATSQGASYGISGNRKSVTTYHAPGSGFGVEGRVKTEQSPDGRLTTYTYAVNELNPENFLVETSTEGTVASPNGVAGKTTRTVRVSNAQRQTVRVDSQVCVGSSGSFVTINSVETDYTEEGLASVQRRNGKVQYEATYANQRLVSEVNQEGVTVNYTYDSLGRLKTITEVGVAGRPDKVTTLTRALGGIDCNCDSDLITTITAGGLSLSTRVKKDKAGRVIEEVDAAGLVTTYAYTNGGRTTTIVHPNTATEVRATYLDGRIKSVTGTGVIAQFYTYGVNVDGSQWNQANQVNPNGPRWSKSTSSFEGRTIRNERPGFAGALLVSTNTYDTQGRLASYAETVEGGTAPVSTGNELLSITTYFYNELDQIIRTETVRGGVTNIAENESNYIATNGTVWQESWSKSDGMVISRSRTRVNNFAGNLESEGWSVGLPEANASDFSWGGAATAIKSEVTYGRATLTRVATTTLPTSVQPAVQTSIGGLLVSSVSSSHGGVTLYQYDALGRQTGVKQPRHTNYATTTYNAQGQVTAVTDATGQSATYTYYGNGVVGAGQLRQTTNALGHSTFHQYDLFGRDVYTWGSATYPVAQGYDTYGQRNLLRTFRDMGANFAGTNFPLDASGDTTTWTYDEVTGILLQKIYADGKGPTYDYYADGPLKTRTWARKDANNNPLTTTYTYTAQGQLAQVDYSDDTPDVAYTYNALGQPTSITDGAGTRTFAYDPETLSLNSEAFSGLVNGTLHRAYDTYNRLTGYALIGAPLATPSTDEVLTAATYGYDTAGRLNQVTGDAVPAGIPIAHSLSPIPFSYARIPNSDLIATVTGPVHTVTNTYEPNRDILTSKQNKTLADTVVSQFDYTVNAIGQRVSRTQSGGAFDGIGYAPGSTLASSMTGVPGIGSSTDSFGYNTRGEVIGSTNTKDATLNRGYAYDPIGNRLTATEGTKTKSYESNNLNQYLSVTSESSVANPVFDDDGNMITDGGGKTYTWDCENRLIQATLPNSEVVRYSYDGNSRRVKREHLNSVSTEMTTYLYDGWNVIAEWHSLNPDTRTLKSYIWGLDLSNTFQGSGGVGGLLGSRTNTPDSLLSTSFLFTYDGNGNVSELLDGSEAIQAHYEYDAFGEGLTVGGIAAQQNTYRFSTTAWDAESELNYYGYRFYQPSGGRWLGRDVIQEWGGLNIYEFVYNNSFSYIDLLGAEPISVIITTVIFNSIKESVKDILVGIIKEILVSALSGYLEENEIITKITQEVHDSSRFRVSSGNFYLFHIPMKKEDVQRNIAAAIVAPIIAKSVAKTLSATTVAQNIEKATGRKVTDEMMEKITESLTEGAIENTIGGNPTVEDVKYLLSWVSDISNCRVKYVVDMKIKIKYEGIGADWISIPWASGGTYEKYISASRFSKQIRQRIGLAKCCEEKKEGGK